MLFMIVFHFFLNSQDKKNGPKRNAQFSFCLQHRNSSWKGNCALHFSNRRRKRSCPLKLGRMGVQVSMVGLDMLSFLIFNRWKLLPVVESAALLAHRNIWWELHFDKLQTSGKLCSPHHWHIQALSPRFPRDIYLLKNPRREVRYVKNSPPEKCQCIHLTNGVLNHPTAWVCSSVIS